MRNFKKTMSVLLAAIMTFSAFSALPFTASAAEVGASNAVGAEFGDYEYQVLDDGTAEIITYNGSAETLTIPSKLDGYTVTSIGDSAFKECTSLTSVSIPSGVTSIKSWAFGRCRNLTNVNIPDSVTSIGDWAFGSCNLSSLTFGKELKVIGQYAFPFNKNLKSVTFNNNLEIIDRYAFDTCISLKEIIIPDSVKEIGLCAFSGCTELENVTIPDSVTSIGGSAFNKTGIYNSQPDSVVYVDGWACGYNGKMPENTSIAFREGTKGIADSAFSSSMLKSVNIPDSVANIGNSSFRACSSLKSVTIGNGVTSISKESFSGCSSITDIKFGNSVTTIGDSAFYNCSSLESITFPDGLTSIGDSSFFRCTGLKNIVFPDNLTEIGGNAFTSCSSLERVTIPANVTKIAFTAFNVRSDSLTIYGYEDSAAENYAEIKGIPFINLSDVPEPLLGDVNGDGVLSVADATLIQKYSASIINFTDEQMAVADMNGDGAVNVNDATAIQRGLVNS